MDSTTASGLTVKRQIAVKTKVTDAFRSRAKEELSNEVRLIENQLAQLDTQYQQTLQQLETMATQGQNVNRQLEQMNQEVQAKRNQLTSLKMEVGKQLGNLDKVADGDLVVTGMLESEVVLHVGDPLYQKVQNGEIVVEDQTIVAINMGTDS